MMLPPHHMDQASSAPLCLLGDRRKPRGSEESIHLSPSHGETYQSRKPRLYLIQGELVDLTGDPLMAAVLWQLVFWSQRVPDFELFVAEEKRTVLQDSSSFYHGWFSKPAQELLAETMFRTTLFTLHRYLDFFVEQRWVQRRTHPQNKGDETIQYRVSLKKLCIELQNHGYSRPGFATYGVLPSSEQENSEKPKYFKVSLASKAKNSFLKGRNI